MCEPTVETARSRRRRWPAVRDRREEARRSGASERDTDQTDRDREREIVSFILQVK